MLPRLAGRMLSGETLESAQAWQAFYGTTGAASATLVGLLFVGLSLHIRVVLSHSDVRSLARVTLSNFFVVLLVSLMLLAPTGDLGVTGLTLMIIAVAALALIVRPMRDALKGGPRALHFAVLVSRFGASTACYAALAGMGGLFASGDPAHGLSGLTGVVILLLVVAVRNTWDLIVTVADRTAQRE